MVNMRAMVAVTNDGYAIVNAMEAGLWIAIYALAVLMMMFSVICLWKWKPVSCEVCCCVGRHGHRLAKGSSGSSSCTLEVACAAGWADKNGDVHSNDGGDGGEEKLMKIWFSAGGDKFHWNRDCRGLGGVAHESRKGRTECLHCFNWRIANKEKAE